MEEIDFSFRIFVECELEKDELIDQLHSNLPEAKFSRRAIEFGNNLIQVENNDLYNKGERDLDKFWRNFRYEIYSYPMTTTTISEQKSLMDKIVFLIGKMGFDCRSVSEFDL